MAEDRGNGSAPMVGAPPDDDILSERKMRVIPGSELSVMIVNVSIQPTDKRKVVLHGGRSWKRLYAHVVGAPAADDGDDAGGQTVRGDPGSAPVATHDRRPCNCVGRGPGQRTSSPTASNGRPGTRPGAASTRRRRRPSLRRRRTGQDTAAIVPEAETELQRWRMLRRMVAAPVLRLGMFWYLTGKADLCIR